MNLYDAHSSIRMLIVDDEPVICEGLRKTIDWSKLDVDVVGEAYDGEEALWMIKEHQVQIVLTDIRMEGMDGLELARRLRTELPHVRIIIMSGYEDFEYARQALRLEVIDYLLKPVNIDELMNTVRKVAESIRGEAAIGRDEKALWLSRVLHQEQVTQAPPQQIYGNSFKMLVSQLENYVEHFAEMSTESYRIVQQNWIHLVRESLTTHGLRCVSVFDHKNLLYTLVMTDQSHDALEWKSWLQKLNNDWKDPSKLCLGLSREIEDVAQIAEAGSEALKLLQHHVIEDQTVFISEMYEHSTQRDKKEFEFKPQVQAMVSALFKQDLDEVLQQVQKLFILWKEERLLLHEAQKMYEEFIILLRIRLRQSGLKEAELNQTVTLDLNIYNSYNSMENIAKQEMEELMRLIDLQGVDKPYWIIEKAKLYMEEQYFNDIKAAEVAEWLKITPSYFSYIFKQSTGKSFREYMNELRIEHAKHLLVTTHDKIFEIAAKVGYNEYKYFVSVFKSFVGMTPKAYRSMNMKRQHHGRK